MLPRARSEAFTIVEMLVVVAILMILLSLLLPNLGKAREAARRSGCASNQHQLHTAQYSSGQLRENSIYMCSTSSYQYNYTVNNWEGNQYLGPWGFLYVEDLLADNMWISCPTQPTKWYDLRNDPNPEPTYGRYNQWPPLVQGPVTDSVARHSRAAYGQRPETTFSFVAPAPGVNYAGTKLLGKRTKLDNFVRKAIFADTCSDRTATKVRHVYGLNVTYGDGAVLFVPHDAYKQSEQSIVPGAFSPANNVFILNKVGNVAVSGLYYDFDQWRENNLAR